MPFMDSIELAAVTGLPDRTVRESLRRLSSHELLGTVSHIRADGTKVKRAYLTLEGIEELAQSRLQGENVFDLMKENDMLSAQGREFLLQRLDVIPVIYRVAQAAAAAVENPRGLCFTWRWERQGTLEAVLQLPDGRTVAISRVGSTHTGKAVRDRLGSIRNMHTRSEAKGRVYTTLLLVPGVIEHRQAAAFMANAGVEGVHVAIESEMVASALDSYVWETPLGGKVSIAETLAKTPPSKMPPTRRPEEDPIAPSPDIRDDAGTMGLVATELSGPARTLLRLLYDYPLIRVPQLQRMMGVSMGHLTRAKAELKKADLVTYPSIGRTVNGRKRNGRRVAPSEKGIRYLRTVDRSSAGLIRGFWLLERCKDGEEGSPKEYHVPGIRVVGTKAHVLLKERLHTDGVYAFMSLLMHSCRSSRFWDVVQALPAHRWERHYKHGTSTNRRFKKISRSIRPDATLVLSHPDRSFASFVLEFERSATSPSTMSDKIEKYQNYFAADETRRDFLDGRPTILFVYETRENAGKFNSHAAKEGGRALPMLVASLEDLEVPGNVFSRCWLNPWELDRGYGSLRPLTPA